MTFGNVCTQLYVLHHCILQYNVETGYPGGGGEYGVQVR